MDECDMCPYFNIDDTCEECKKHRRDTHRHVNEYDDVDEYCCYYDKQFE